LHTWQRTSPTECSSSFRNDQRLEEQALAAIPARRVLRPDESCAAVRYLLADDSRYVVGHTLVLDGGFTAQ
jgi:NAD(P)-dependent dehydrogenase (short-subunit alcohol dehydrogenase family)